MRRPDRSPPICQRSCRTSARAASRRFTVSRIRGLLFMPPTLRSRRPGVLSRCSESYQIGLKGVRSRPVGAGRARILVVEDDSELARLSTGVLERAGYEVVVAGSGAECIRI